MDDEHRLRLERLMGALGSAVLVLPTAAVTRRGGGSEHDYRGHSDFLYLTGFQEPSAVLVVAPRASERVSLFLEARDPEREVWDGERLGLERAVLERGVDAAYPIAALSERLPMLLRDADAMYFRLGAGDGFEPVVLRALERARALGRRGVGWPTSVIEPGVLLHELRRIKSSPELARMRRAADITCDAHIELMRVTRPGMYEYELEALLRHRFREHGSQGPAYSPIVAAGDHATVLHYVSNDGALRDGDLLLVDAGCEHELYAADVTRTFPVGKTFSPAQAELYDLVLEAQRLAIEQCRPGRTMLDVHRTAVRTITEGLVRLELLRGEVDELVEKKKYQTFFMHSTSHYLGMDVHDAGRYFEGKRAMALEPDVVITVEPGIYVPRDAEAPEPYRGIGIRIEDDVRIGAEQPEILTARAPRERSEVERLRGGG
jgi:Xaa-Pro aminopeptidase